MDLADLLTRVSHLPSKIVGGIWVGIALFLLGFALMSPSFVYMLGGVTRRLRYGTSTQRLGGLLGLAALLLTPFLVVGGIIWLQFLQEG